MTKQFSVICSMLLLTACATTETQTFSSDPLVRPGAKIQLGSVTVPPEKSYETDAAGLMRSALQISLSENDIAWQGEPDSDRFVLDIIVQDYEPGNAFKRWLLPGYGSTIVHVSGKLTDLSTGELAGEVDYERGVHWGGGYTIGTWETVFQNVADDIAKELANRINNKGFVIRLTPWPARDIDIPVAETRDVFTITAVTDSRPERGRIGERTAAFSVSMGDVFFDRVVPAFIEEAVAAELLGAGHQITNDQTGRPVSLEVVSFWTHTDTTMFYWDVISNIEIAVTVGATMEDQNPKQATVNCEAKKRTYVWPSLGLVSEVLDNCLIDLMSNLRGNAVWDDG